MPQRRFFRFHVTFRRFMMFCAKYAFFNKFFELKGVPKVLRRTRCRFLLKLLTKKSYLAVLAGSRRTVKNGSKKGRLLLMKIEKPTTFPTRNKKSRFHPYFHFLANIVNFRNIEIFDNFVRVFIREKSKRQQLFAAKRH